MTEAEAALTIMTELTPLVADAAIVGRNYGWLGVVQIVLAVKRELLAQRAEVRRLRHIRARIDMTVRAVVQDDAWARCSRTSQEASIRNALYDLFDRITP